MANSVDQVPFGIEQRALAPAGVKTNAQTGSSYTGKMSPVNATAAATKPPVGMVNTGLKGDANLDVTEAVARIQDYVQDTQRSLEFRLDDDTGITVVSVFDSQTHELIRQIPSEEAVSLAQKLNQEEPLRLFRAQV